MRTWRIALLGIAAGFGLALASVATLTHAEKASHPPASCAVCVHVHASLAPQTSTPLGPPVPGEFLLPHTPTQMSWAPRPCRRGRAPPVA